jgi:AcrR family transcriptional regulator
LEAAVRVLEKHGAQRFTTARVAEVAGVSVGSLYQYFPNKEAILFRLQTDEWQRTQELLDSILADSRQPPLCRLRSAVLAFFQSEWDEAPLRRALGDAVPLYRHAPEGREHRRDGVRRMLKFMSEALPGIPRKERAFSADVAMTIMSVVGKKVSEQSKSRAEMDVWAIVVGEMLSSHLQRLIER